MHIGSSCCTAVFASPPLFADNQEASHDTQWLLPSNQIKDIWINNWVSFSEQDVRDLGRCHAVTESDYNHLETHGNALRSIINVTNIQREAGKRVGRFTNTEYVYTCFTWTICSQNDFWPLHTVHTLSWTAPACSLPLCCFKARGYYCTFYTCQIIYIMFYYSYYFSCRKMLYILL